MAKVLVLYYSMYGHTETMSTAVAEGAKSVGGNGHHQTCTRQVPGRHGPQGGRQARSGCAYRHG